MREMYGDLWTLGNGAVVAILTNGQVRADGTAVMGAGVARQAAEKFPGLAAILGRLILEKGNRCHYLGAFGEYEIVSFPTKHHWQQPSDVRLIRRSAIELKFLAEHYAWPKVYVPRPGCGLGGLKWSDVKPVLEPILDNRFIIVTYGRR